MRHYITLLLTLAGLQVIAQTESIPLTQWNATNSEGKGKALMLTDGDTVALQDFMKAAGNFTVDLDWGSKKLQPATEMQATLVYDDLVTETFTYTLQPDAVKDNWTIEPAYAKGRRVKDLVIEVIDGSGVIAITETHYKKGAPVKDLTMNQMPQYIELRDGKTRKNDVMVISYPINTPPHLADNNARKVYFTASIASSDPKEMEGTATLTLYATDYSSSYHDELKVVVTSEPKEYSITIAPEREVKNQYFLIMQPAPGNPNIAIRHFRIEESDVEHID